MIDTEPRRLTPTPGWGHRAAPEPTARYGTGRHRPGVDKFLSLAEWRIK